jgi:hypothetical protein
MKTFEQRPWEEDEELYRDPIIQDEKDCLEVKLGEEVEPTKVVYHQLSLLTKNNIWLKLRLQLHSSWSHRYT